MGGRAFPALGRDGEGHRIAIADVGRVIGMAMADVGWGEGPFRHWDEARRIIIPSQCWEDPSYPL